MKENKLYQYFKLLSGISAAVPGLTVMVTNLALPPTISGKLLGGMVEACSCFVIAMALVNKERYLKKGDQCVFIAKCAIGVSLISFASYIAVYNHSNDIPIGKSSRKTLDPFWISNSAQAFIRQEGNGRTTGDYFSIEGPVATEKMLQLYSPISIWVTQLTIYLNFILIFFSLTVAFTSLWIKYEANKT